MSKTNWLRSWPVLVLAGCASPPAPPAPPPPATAPARPATPYVVVTPEMRRAAPMKVLGERDAAVYRYTLRGHKSGRFDFLSPTEKPGQRYLVTLLSATRSPFWAGVDDAGVWSGYWVNYDSSTFFISLNIMVEKRKSAAQLSQLSDLWLALPPSADAPPMDVVFVSRNVGGGMVTYTYPTESPPPEVRLFCAALGVDIVPKAR